MYTIQRTVNLYTIQRTVTLYTIQRKDSYLVHHTEDSYLVHNTEDSYLVHHTEEGQLPWTPYRGQLPCTPYRGQLPCTPYREPFDLRNVHWDSLNMKSIYYCPVYNKMNTGFPTKNLISVTTQRSKLFESREFYGCLYLASAVHCISLIIILKTKKMSVNLSNAQKFFKCFFNNFMPNHKDYL